MSYRNIVYGAILVLLGLGGLLVGVAVPSLLVVGIVGFLIMLGGVVLAVTPTRGLGKPTTAGAKRPAPQGASASFMDRMNDRWDKRQGDHH